LSIKNSHKYFVLNWWFCSGNLVTLSSKKSLRVFAANMPLKKTMKSGFKISICLFSNFSETGLMKFW
jgi:hypothetical protein